MRFIKLAILSFIFLFLQVTLISLFFPSHIRISKAVDITAAADTAEKYISNLSAWSRWHPALKEVPENEIIINQDGSLSVKGTLIRMVEKKPGEVLTEIKKGKGQSVKTGLKIIPHAGSGSLTLQWYMDFRLRWYPWEKFKSLFYENIYGVQMEQGLDNLKNLIER
jgi:hypothetical protein